MTEKLLRQMRRYKSGAGPFTEKNDGPDKGFDFGPFGRGGFCVVSACLAATLAGCSISMPIASLASSAPNEDASGAAPKFSLSRLLEGEDWRRAKAALATALDPQGDGSFVGWENPQSGDKGSFTPVGKAYAADARICRVFVCEIDRKGNEQRSLRGTACAEKGGDWTIDEIAPLKKT